MHFIKESTLYRCHEGVFYVVLVGYLTSEHGNPRHAGGAAIYRD